jgi:hypothetical protein
MNGQALAELSIFASLFLFVLSILIQYGMSFNYQQEAKMLSFRHAITLAETGSRYALPGRYVGVGDRAIPDAQDEVGAPEHYPFVASASVVKTNYLAGEKEIVDDEVPKIQFAINDTTENLTTGSYNHKDFPRNSTLSMKKERAVMFPGQISYKWVEIDLWRREVKYEGIDYWFVDPEWSNWSQIGDIVGKRADVDGDGIEETIAKLDEEVDMEWEASEGRKFRNVFIIGISYLDDQEGDLDLADENQGLRPGYSKDLTVNAGISRTENQGPDPDGIVSITDIDAKEVLSHKLVTQSGHPEDVVTDFTTKQTITWETPND